MPTLTPALALHKKLRGKICITTTTPLRNARDLSLTYTPGVAEPCREIAKDVNKVYDYTWKGNTIMIVTDGTAVLGLGDIGPEASLPVMEGKSLLFKEFGNVNCVPICLATKDPKEIIRTVELLAPAYGGVNLEDIAAPACFEIEKELKKRLKIPVFHDDQHGTAIVVLAGLLNAAKVVKKDIKKLRIVINGAGSAGLAITSMLHAYGLRDIVLVDSKGIVETKRKDLNSEKATWAKQTNPRKLSGGLVDAIANADVFVGVSKGTTLTADMVRSMADKSIVFAMANPTPEIDPKDAKKAGAYIVATGRSDYPNQVNNLLAFPGIFRAALDMRAQITEEMKLAAALAIAACVKKPTAECIIPSALDKSVGVKVAAAVKKAVKVKK